MSTQPQFATADLDRFAGLCAWCANGVSVSKNAEGEYAHFADGRQLCAASALRKSLEKTPIERMHDCWEADRCPIEGNLKRSRKDWFCVGCWRKLPSDVRNALLYRPGRAITQWLQAMAMLKKAKETNNG